MSDARRFPIQGGPDVPWDVMAPFNEVCKRNHGGQSLEQIAERCGLSPGEAWAVVSGYKYTGLETKEQWSTMDTEWRKYAERVNGPYAQLDTTTAELEKVVRNWYSRGEEIDALKEQLARYRAAWAEDQVERYIAGLAWTTCTPDGTITLVNGNIRAFAADRRRAAEGG